jgi:MFS superfamily sulfate permease-like transporter
VLPTIASTPEPVIAAIVIHAVSHTLNPVIFRPYFVWRRDRLVVLAAVIAVLLLGVLDGLLAGIGISLMLMMRRFSESRVSVLGRLGESHNFVDMLTHPDARPIEGIIIVRPDEQLFFANVERILNQARQSIAAKPSIHTVIVSLEETPDLDSSSAEALRDFFGTIGKEGKRLILARLKRPVHELLSQLVPPGLDSPVFSDLSVDDAVRMAVGERLE